MGLRAELRHRIPPAVLVGARSMRRTIVPQRSTWLTDGVGVGESHGVRVRPLERADGPAWSSAMRSNYERMSEWWSMEGDLVDATSRLAFEEHVQEWNGRRRRGEGLCLALIGPDGLIGEFQLWHMWEGGQTCEGGLWMAPGQPREVARGATGCMMYVVDRLMNDLGIGRLDAPVAADNPLPRPLLQLGGFELDASVPRWRMLHDRLADYDLFGLTPERWAAARPRGWEAIGPWGRAAS